VREARLEERRLAEAAAYAFNPDADFWVPRGPPPPPPGLAPPATTAAAGPAGASRPQGRGREDDGGARGCGGYVARDVYILQRHGAAAGSAPDGPRWEVTSVPLRV
jgi:hypothetical protein